MNASKSLSSPPRLAELPSVKLKEKLNVKMRSTLWRKLLSLKNLGLQVSTNVGFQPCPMLILEQASLNKSHLPRRKLNQTLKVIANQTLIPRNKNKSSNKSNPKVLLSKKERLIAKMKLSLTPNLTIVNPTVKATVKPLNELKAD
jgi:hypothetical protein